MVDSLPKQPHCYLSLDQVRESQLLSPERMAAVEAEIERRISIPLTPNGKPIETARLADLSPWPLYLYPRMDHDPQWLYIRREIMAVVLTEEERKLLETHGLHAAERRRMDEAYAKATKVKSEDWPGWVFNGEQYYESVEALFDEWAELVEDGEMGFNDHPAYVWAAKAHPVITGRDVADVFECQMCDNGWEDMDLDDFRGVSELQAALDAFTKANDGVVSYRPDYSIAITITVDTTERLADTECNVSGIHPIHQR